MGGFGEYMKHAEACAQQGYKGYNLSPAKAQAA
jgi:hypothetical protein